MKPFPDRGRLTAEQRKFNLKFSALRCVVERAFGMLKSRWRIILKKIEQKTTTLKRTVIAACVLHNICIERETYTTQTIATQTMALMMTTEGEMLLKPATIFEIR